LYYFNKDFKCGKLYDLHHFLTALSETLYILPISTNDLECINFSKVSLSGIELFRFEFLTFAAQLIHLEFGLVTTRPQSKQ